MHFLNSAAVLLTAVTWSKSDGVFDLTRSDRLPVTTPKMISGMIGGRKNAIIEPSRTGLVIIDMQNYFLHPGLSPGATKGRAIVNTTVSMVDGFRKAGIKVLWTNWGLDDFDLLTMPPAFLSGFSANGSDLQNETFGSDMGTVDGIPAGRLLMRNQWNSQLYGPLHPLQVEGVDAGTDFYFNKNRLSGMWGAQTPLGLFLQENGITTLFFGGVNTDQCVWGTFLDSYYKGFDVFLVPDISATTSPQYATDMCIYNADGDGFVVNSTTILPAIA
ncbi:Isochorismatase hydrolase [Rhizodiscina lignyota]|uniref:Isochorismatase hydrolase n=1 Tax=Rhizodiscina lignyota TaxID=1504668 RepID=A0A9P4MFY1_9PEZI|nr:Isochorismatase hydrolase [Rhizodiscina lignyota]